MPALQPALKLFASGLPDRTLQQDYSDFYSWYDGCKQLAPDAERPHSPGVTDGDVFWMQNFGTAQVGAKLPKIDLRDIALRTLAESKPDITLDQLRMKTLSPVVVAIRSTVMERAIRADHRTIDIANFLNTSDSTVSRHRTRMALATPP
jgi:hypothetical protein